MVTRKKRTAAQGNKKFVFQLSLSGFFSLAVLVVIGMAWSFILGVIVGRGYQPEKIALQAVQQVLPADFPLLTEKNEEVLKAEELEFFDKLKQKPEQASTAAAASAVKKPPPAPPAATTAAAAPKPAQPAPVEKKAEQAPADLAAAKEEVFVFNYQVAALASMDQAKIVTKQLEPGGFKTSVVEATHEGKTWFRVYVHHQGTVESAKAMKEQLKGSGIDNILLRSRTPL